MDIGFFGKLPFNGDFVQRRLAPAVVSEWDRWLQASLQPSRRDLGDHGQSAYLDSPAWRFIIKPGVLDQSGHTGILFPSVDSVGRNFPCTLMQSIESPEQLRGIASHGNAWYRGLESLALDCLQNGHGDIESFDRRLIEAGRTAQPACKESLLRRADGNSLFIQNRHELNAGDFLSLLYLESDSGSFWWTKHCEARRPGLISCTRLPSAQRFETMLNGARQISPDRSITRVGPACATHQIDADEFEVVDRQAPLEEPVSAVAGSSVCVTFPQPRSQPRYGTGTPLLQVESHAGIHRGSGNAGNSSACLRQDERRLWVIAEGLAGQVNGEFASRFLIQALKATPLSPDLDTGVELIQKSLYSANRQLIDLRQTDIIGSTILVVAVISGWASILWVGDNHAYLYRDREPLKRLTQGPRLHAIGKDAVSQVSTLALGVDTELSIACKLIKIRNGDRLLLCNDGLCEQLSDPGIQRVLAVELSPRSACEQLLQKSLHRPANHNSTAIVIDIG